MPVSQVDRLIEAAFETSNRLPKEIKRVMEKIFKRKELKAAIAQYLKFKANGVSDGTAMHKAAGMYGLASDRLFSDIIWQMRKDGTLDEATIPIVISILEEDEPTNTSKGVAPDQEDTQKKPKKKPKKKKDCDMKEENTYKGIMCRIELSEGKGLKMNAQARRAAGKAIYNIAKQNHFSSIAGPVYDADKALQKLGYKLVDIDGSDYAAIYTGKEGRASIDIGDMDGNLVQNTMLAIQWYKMGSGMWEVNMYLT